MTKAYVTAEGVYLMSFDGDVPPPTVDAIEVPTAPSDARQIWDFVAEEWGAVPPPTPAPTVPRIYAVAILTVDAPEINGIGVNSRFSAAIYVDVGLYYVFFAETQPDMEYLAKGYDDVARVSVIEKTTDYIVVQALDAAGDPVDPSEVSIEIIRVS